MSPLLNPADLIAAIERTAARRVTRGEVVWHIWGEGPPLVLLHGGTGSWLHWVRNVEALAREFRVLAADLPGSGDSGVIEPPITADAMAERLYAGVGEIIGTDAPFSIAGFSLGGLIGSHLAKCAGNRAQRLILVGSGGTEVPRRQMEPLKSWRWLASEEEKREAHRANLGILMIYDRAKIDALALHIQTRNAVRSRIRVKHFAHRSALAECLPQVSARIAGIWGEHDVTAAPEPAREVLRGFQPQAPFAVVPGVGHWVQYEAADTVNRLIAEQLAALARA
jgi:pimeloyl-ACP methyl ester carboxylesterase